LLLAIEVPAFADAPARDAKKYGKARAETQPKWEQFDEVDGIRMYRREVPGSDVVALRGEGFVAAPIARVATVLADRKRAPEWIDRLVETKVLRVVSETESVHWNRISTPFPLAERDFVFKTVVTTDPKQKKVIFSYHSVADPAAPQSDRYVRGQFRQGRFELTMAHIKKPDGSKVRGTIVLAEVLVDPKGAVPTWIVNMVQKSWPHKTISALRQQVAKQDIKDNPRIVERLTREGFFE
jgi:hypothetical protein